MNIAIYIFIKLTLFRYFTSIPLLQTLKSYGIYGCGTIMVNRKGFPAQLKNPHLANRGDAEQMQHNNLVATVWNDAKPVCLHSLILTFHFIEHLQFSYTVKLYIVFIFLIIRFVHLFFEGSHCIHYIWSPWWWSGAKKDSWRWCNHYSKTTCCGALSAKLLWCWSDTAVQIQESRWPSF